MTEHIKICWIILALILASTTSKFSVAKQSDNKELEFEPPKLITKFKPVYPKSLLKESSSGVVELGFMVNAEGTPYEVMVLRSSHPDFEKPAIKELKNSKYSPALLKGKPYENYKELRVNFQVGDEQGVIRSFSREYRRIRELFNKENPDQKLIFNRIKKLEESYFLTLYAISHLNKLKYTYQEKFGDLDGKIDALETIVLHENSTLYKDGFIDKKNTKAVYQKLFLLYLEKADYSKAYAVYQKIVKIDPELKQSYQEAITKLNAISKDETAYEYKIKIPSRGYSNLNLWKRNFSFLKLEGKLETIKLRCDLKFKELPFQFESLYQIPKSWGDCNLQIIGDEGSKVSLIQQ